ncbi:uncharacterized protein LOC123307136 [Coccinella septempunctata]|uniref:uncharacterized protein LOC123307136 n=1 Tax=Coccinella septempunctata TaxID=41139 RepID=UPI001D0855AA|nr:uncharacterized protein LOC123307136 [Coccinella septempunctata]
MNFGTWNVQGMKDKVVEISRECESLRMDIVVLTETKKKGIGSEILDNYVHIFGGVPKDQRAKRGVSLLIHKKHKHKITDFESVSENIIRVNMNLFQTPVTILGVYAVSNDEPSNIKDEFFERMNDEISKIGKSREVILLGDLNSRVGQRVQSKVVGPYGETTLNDNGERLIDICDSHQLKIQNGFFKHKDIHTYTWVQHTRNLRSIIDYIITLQNTRVQVKDVRAYRGVTCGSDHYIVRAKMLFPYKHVNLRKTRLTDETEEITSKNYNTEGLMHDSIRTLYQQRLDQKLEDWTEKSVSEVYRNIINSIQTAAEESLGIKNRLQNNKLWWNDEIEELIRRKKQLYQKWLNTQTEEDRGSYMEMKRLTRRTISAAKRQMWDKKCMEINTYLGGSECSETWKFIKRVKSSGRNQAGIQIIPTGKWINHYEQLLTENRSQYNTISPSEISVKGEEINIDVATLERALTKLKNGRATGPEGIPAELIKNGTRKLFEALTWCVNKFINGAPIPEQWKIAYISSIHKKGDKLNCGNYRGISVTSTMSRLYGRILRDLIESEYSDQEEEEQSGFRADRTCTDNFVCWYIYSISLLLY